MKFWWRSLINKGFSSESNWSSWVICGYDQVNPTEIWFLTMRIAIDIKNLVFHLIYGVFHQRKRVMNIITMLLLWRHFFNFYAFHFYIGVLIMIQMIWCDYKHFCRNHIELSSVVINLGGFCFFQSTGSLWRVWMRSNCTTERLLSWHQ